MAAQPAVIHQIVSTGTAAANGGTFVVDTPVPLDTLLMLRATCALTAKTGAPAHLNFGGVIIAEYVVRNSNGTLTAPAALTGSANPANASNIATGDAQGTDFSGGAPSSAVFSISTTNARLTLTNQHLTQAADALVWIQYVQCAS